jgi:cytochrome c oxidase subunit 2
LFSVLLLGIAAACSREAPPSRLPASSPTAIASQLSGPELGRALAIEFGCAACLSPDGNISVGPTWNGLYGKEESLTGGVKIKVDEAYLRESILDPNAKIVQGFFPGVMPQGFGNQLSDQQIQALVEHIKTLR